MNFFAFSGVVIFVSSLACSLLVFISSPKNTLKTTWSLFSFSVCIWGLGIFEASRTGSYQQSLFWFRFLNLTAITIPIFFFHFVLLFTNKIDSKKSELILYYWIIFIFLFFCLVFPQLFVSSVSSKLSFHFYANPGLFYYFFPILFFSLACYGVILLLKEFQVSTSIRREQTKYILIGVTIGFLGGGTSFLLVFDIKLYPFGTIFVPIYILTISYAIVRYRFMDIKTVLTKAAIFIFVYTLILGIPILLGFKLLGRGLWLLPLSIMGFFATAGPFIYMYLQKRAEDALLQEQRRYQATLRQASAGMGKIKDLKKLLNMIVYVLTHAIQIEHALIYIYDESQKQYVLGAAKRKSGHNHFIESIGGNSLLVGYFLENKDPLIFEEIKQKAQDYKDLELAQIEQIVASLNGELLVPIFIDQTLTALIVMGKKESGKVYSEDDLAVFSILANQTALAIENAKFYEDMKLTHEQLFQAEKMATIGTMADGLSHQINNRFHALGFIAGDALDTIRLNQKDLTPDKMKEIMTELDRAFVRVQENVVQGGEVVQGLLKYTRKGEAGFSALDVQAVFKSALEMAQFKIKTDQLKIIHDYDPAIIPKIKGNFTQLQEVFFNLIDNGYDAMMQRKNEKKEPGYQPTLIVRVFKQDNYAQIVFEDNGMGVKEEDTHKLFTPFFTTKLSSKKGTGLGLYVIKKIVEDNHGGTVEMISKYMQGTQMKLRLPIAIG